LDEVFVKINGKLCYLWRAVDHEGEVLETVVTAKRDKAAALMFLKRIMKKYGQPRSVVTDELCSYPAAMKEIGNIDRHEVGRRLKQSLGEFAPMAHSHGLILTGNSCAPNGIVMSGRRSLIKGYFWRCAGRGCGHVFGLSRGQLDPLALMLSADPLPRSEQRA
jgi:transposase-like protein